MSPDKAIQDSSPRKAEALVCKLGWKQVRTREIQDYIELLVRYLVL
jgi:hypothetical protein